MGKGYAEGPATEERFEAAERGDLGGSPSSARERLAVYGSTPDDGGKHFIGWLGDVDPDRLFASGAAWGISIVRRVEDA